MADFETEFAAATRVYDGSDGAATMALYGRLNGLGAAGVIAVHLFRAHKNSARAKLYRGGVRGRGSYRRMAYDRKDWSIGNLCEALRKHAEGCGIAWGWGEDAAEPFYNAVLYVDLPSGQVSFHTTPRGAGPDYPGIWDGVRDAGAERICRWAARLLAEPEPTPLLPGLLADA